MRNLTKLPNNPPAHKGGRRITKLKTERPLIRETADFEHGTPYVVELHPGYMSIRLKGSTRHAHRIDYGSIYWLALKRDEEKERRQRLAGLKERTQA